MWTPSDLPNLLVEYLLLVDQIQQAIEVAQTEAATGSSKGGSTKDS